MPSSRSFSRRNFLARGSAMGSAIGFGTLLGQRISDAWEPSKSSAPFQRCVVLWMEGGPSQLDTFDPKENSLGGSPAIATSTAGLSFADTLPGLAQRADELCIVRSVGSREGEHIRASELMHTGFAPVPSFPRPSVGSFVSSDREECGFPRSVTLGSLGFGPAFLGSQHGPFVIEDLAAAQQQLERVSRQRPAIELLSKLNADYATSNECDAIQQRTSSVESIRRLLETPFADRLDLRNASEQDRQRYGDHLFGQRVLAARRLLELGVPFVEVQLTGWDTHIDNQRRTGELCSQLEKPWLALMDDLQRTALWDDTLVVWMGEFGRTPRLNGRAGRDHFPESIPVVLSGGNLGGRVVGATSADGGKRIGQTHTVGDLMATLLTLMGLDVDARYTTDFGGPTTATDEGTAITDLVSA